MTRISDFSKVAFADLAAPTSADGAPWPTPEGIAVKSAYAARDLEGLIGLDGFPGIPPYLRGPYPTMYDTQPWTIRQYAGFSSAEDSNAFYRRNLAAGLEKFGGKVCARGELRRRTKRGEENFRPLPGCGENSVGFVA